MTQGRRCRCLPRTTGDPSARRSSLPCARGTAVTERALRLRGAICRSTCHQRGRNGVRSPMASRLGGPAQPNWTWTRPEPIDRAMHWAAAFGTCEYERPSRTVPEKRACSFHARSPGTRVGRPDAGPLSSEVRPDLSQSEDRGRLRCPRSTQTTNSISRQATIPIGPRRAGSHSPCLSEGCPGQLYPFFRPNQGVLASGAYFWDEIGMSAPDATYARQFWHLRIPDQPLSDIELPNGIALRCTEPQRSWEISYRDPDTDDASLGVSLDLTFTGVQQAELPGRKSPRSTGPFPGSDQALRRGDPVDSFGFRDRSWGPRSQFGQGIHGTSVRSWWLQLRHGIGEGLVSTPSRWISVRDASQFTVRLCAMACGQRCSRDRDE